jgi:hypothetical protein
LPNGLGNRLFFPPIFQNRHSLSIKHGVFRIMYCNQIVDNFSQIAVVIILHQTGCDHVHPHSICLTPISFRNEKYSMLQTFGTTVGSFKKCHLDRNACFFFKLVNFVDAEDVMPLYLHYLFHIIPLSHDQEMIACCPCCETSSSTVQLTTKLTLPSEWQCSVSLIVCVEVFDTLTIFHLFFADRNYL